MKRSIRRFLIFNLLLSITIASSLTAVGTYVLDNKAIQRHLDMQLQQIAIFLKAIVSEKNTLKSLHKIQQTLLEKTQNTQIRNQKFQGDQLFDQSFRFQLWGENNKLVLRSMNASTDKLTNVKNGFTNVEIGESTWRVYSSYDPKLKLTFIVGEPNNFRTQLEKEITWDNLLILIWIYPLLGILIWLTVGSSLTSLKKTAHELSCRPVTDFSPIDTENTPLEVTPLINELNELFLRLQKEFERNKRFASDAAHELRTPLAALKTQAQVALLTSTASERNAVMKKLLLGVDRCTHIVHQLLTLSRVEQEASLHEMKHVNLTSITAEIIAQLAPLALEKHIDIELKKPETAIIMSGNETMLSILIRNLVDNAIRYTPEEGNVVVEVFKSHQQAVLRVSDTGPGISPELRPRVFERFYRVLGNKASGSGLGLAIVQQIAELHQAKIQLDTPTNGQGLQIDIIFPEKLSLANVI